MMPRTNYESECCESDDEWPTGLWKYFCFAWSEILFGVAALLCAIGWSCKEKKPEDKPHPGLGLDAV